MFTYLFIFFSKIIENTLSTLRLIVVANGKKKLGAILNGIISFTWIFSTSIVIININKDVFKIFFFCLGAIVGSYLGSVIEEKIAIARQHLIPKQLKNNGLEDHPFTADDATLTYLIANYTRARV